jgi:hypothetical protein
MFQLLDVSMNTDPIRVSEFAFDDLPNDYQGHCSKTGRITARTAEGRHSKHLPKCPELHPRASRLGRYKLAIFSARMRSSQISADTVENWLQAFAFVFAWNQLI